MEIHLIGLGTFGRAAAGRLAGKAPLVLVDPAPGRAESLADELGGADMHPLARDGVAYTRELLAAPGRDQDLLVPTLPLHLAAEVIISLPCAARGCWPEPPPFPRATLGPRGDCYSSLAAAACPDDCPGPEGCRLGEHRAPGLLHRILAGIPLARPHLVIESCQLAPGTGGFALAELRHWADRCTTMAGGSCILTTASTCHAVSTPVDL